MDLTGIVLQVPGSESNFTHGGPQIDTNQTSVVEPIPIQLSKKPLTQIRRPGGLKQVSPFNSIVLFCILILLKV